jgi:NADH dehydrogenase FAD-containing subunit
MKSFMNSKFTSQHNQFSSHVLRQVKAIQHFSSVRPPKLKVIVLGSGWAGFRFLRGIDQKFFEVSVVSPRNHFIFTPLLASTTVGTLEYRAVIEPTRTVCQNYLQAECTGINHKENKITCLDIYNKQKFDLDYDYLIISVGSVPNTFGIKGVKEYCHFLRQINDARQIRKRIIQIFEEASSPMTSKEERHKLLTFVIVGGGPTSCEFSAELHDFLVSDFKRWYPSLSIDEVNIILIESTDHILGMFDSKLSDYADKYFKRQKIKILTKMTVSEVKENKIFLKDGLEIPFGLCVWSTGNTANDFVKSLYFKKDPRGRLLVDNYLRIIGSENIFAIGDCSTQENSNLPQTAQCAQQEGAYLCKAFNLISKGTPKEKIRKFEYSSFGMMSYIGGYNAIVDISGNRLKGHSAWLFWRSAYLTKLLSIRNKILVPMYWFKAFVFGRDISTF